MERPESRESAASGALVGVVMGSRSDWEVLQHTADILRAERRERGGGDEAFVVQFRVAQPDECSDLRTDGGERREFLAGKWTMKDGTRQIGHARKNGVTCADPESAECPISNRRTAYPK